MNTLKKITLYLLIALFLVGCSQPASEEKSLLDTIKENGYITVATSPDWPPYEFIDPSKTGDDQYVGADMELARYIAKELGVELKILASEFNTAVASVATKKADFIISDLGYKEERLEAMDFSKTYNPNSTDENTYQGLLMDILDADEYTELEHFNSLNIGVQMGSLQEAFVKEQIPQATLTHIKDIGTGILMLQNKKIDAIAITNTIGNAFAQANGGLKMSVARFEESILAEYDGTVVGVQKGATELLETINDIIDDVVANKLYDQWEIEYTEYAKDIGA